MKKQLDLFGASVTLPPLPAPDPRFVALGHAIPSHVRLGCSTWTFKGWTGLVYRRGYRNEADFVRDSLHEYARFPVFGTVGIDRSFYNPLTEDEWSGYAALLPDGFRCVSKVWRDLSTYCHAGQFNPHFLNVDMFNALVAGPSQAFGEHRGPFVVEVSPFSGRLDTPRFERALELFLQKAQGQFAFEIREPRLLTPRYFALLREYGASHCFNQWAWMPSIAEQLQLAGGTQGMGSAVVARLMLPHAAEYEDLKAAYAPFDRIVDPQPAMRANVLQLAEEVRTAKQVLYVVVNNKAEGSAPWTCIALAELLASSGRVSPGQP